MCIIGKVALIWSGSTKLSRICKVTGKGEIKRKGQLILKKYKNNYSTITFFKNKISLKNLHKKY